MPKHSSLNSPKRMKPLLVHGTIVPEIEDSFSPNAIDMVGQLMMKGLASPFTWEAIIFDKEGTDIMVDRLPLAVRPWDSIIKKCHLAYSEFHRGFLHQSSAYIAECYIPLLEVPGLETSCELTKRYRPALKHVVDATSAFIRLAFCEDWASRRRLYESVRSIPAVDSMDANQEAAIHAIRSRVTLYPQNHMFARSAIELNADEHQWHFYLSKTIYDEEENIHGMLPDSQKARLMGDLLKHNTIAFQSADKIPESLLHMANILLTFDHSNRCEKAYAYIQKALKQFPDSAFVHEEAANVLQKWPRTCPLERKYYLLIEPLYRKALKIIGKQCLTVKHKLGVHQVLHAPRRPELCEKSMKEGLSNLAVAAIKLSDALLHYKFAKEGKLNFSALGESTPRILCDHDGGSSSEDSSVDHRSMKQKSRKKK